MSTPITHWDGSMEEGFEVGIPSLLAELDGSTDDENPDVSVTDDESSWTVSAFQDGSLVLENLDDGSIEPCHLRVPSRSDMIRVMALVVRGDMVALHRLDWLPGYG
ncbi:hypothetical protein [Streptomyces sp. ST2-7A]|uniref:hypothetical protein n=1 Tax=Streptomyces sp. ST2-7A TaxID=2907214 RepID=UPI001F243999|nr:hypothetical protein [Streptomyces sp. ST2-7A]MCE7078728.1 hypothetical protein [Streptomyces sp. ST2-7A]